MTRSTMGFVGKGTLKLGFYSLLLAACGEEESRDPVWLVNHASWSVDDAATDPLAGHRPTTVSCPAGAHGFEGADYYEVDTGNCNYVSLVQPSLAKVSRGAQIELNLWHLALDAAAPATAHVALMLDDVVLWEQMIAIPGPPANYELLVEAEQDFPAGLPVRIHLHNHGDNAWRFRYMRVVR